MGLIAAIIAMVRTVEPPAVGWVAGTTVGVAAVAAGMTAAAVVEAVPVGVTAVD